jgi:hypothetical protein
VLGALEPGGHGVEGLRERVDLRPGTHGRHPGPVAAAGHVLGGAGELGERAPQPAGEGRRHGRRAEQGGQQGDPERPQAGVTVGTLGMEELGGAGLRPRPQEVLVEQRWAGQGRHDRRGEHARDHHEQLGEQEARGQSALARRPHGDAIR